VSGQRIARATGWFLLLGVLGTGLWQCARDVTGTGSGGLRLALRTPPADSVEIEIRQGTGVVASDTVAIAQGTFEALLAIPSGVPSDVCIFAWGVGEDLKPDSLRRAVLAFGRRSGVKAERGRLTEVSIDASAAVCSLVELNGFAGQETVRVRWRTVAGASAYTVGWYATDGNAEGRESGIGDTLVALPWETSAAGDSVTFRVQPEFNGRSGAFGPDSVIDLAVWMDLPRLVHVAPVQGASVEADTVRVWLGFDRPMDEESLAGGVSWTRTGDAISVVVDTVLVPAPGLYVLVPAVDQIEREETYDVTVSSAVTSADGRPFDADPDTPGLQAAAIQWSTSSYDPLRVVGMDPAAGATDADPAAPVKVALNRPVDASTLDETTCYLIEHASGETIPGLVDTAGAADTVLWTPRAERWFSTRYLMHLTSGLRDRLGRPLDDDLATPELEDYSADFTTYEQPLGPRVVAIEPADSATAVAIDAEIRVTFSEPIEPTSVRYDATFQLLREGLFALPGSFAFDSEASTVTFTPHAALQRNVSYQVRILEVTDLDGHPLDQDRDLVGYDPFDSEFRTEGPPAVTSSDPFPGETWVDVDHPIRIRFSTTIEETSITASSIVLSKGETAVDCGRGLSADSLEVTLTPGTALDYLSRYDVLVDTLILAVDGSRFDQHPDSAGRRAHRFFFTSEPESLPPRVTEMFPADGDTNVAVGDSIHLAFSRPIAPPTLSAGGFSLRPAIAPADTVAGLLVVAADSLTADFIPDSALASGAFYEARVETTVTSGYGFGLDQDPGAEGFQPFTRSFRTENETIPPDVVSSQPEADATGVPVMGDIVIEFSEAMREATVAGAFSLTPEGGEAATGAGELDVTGAVWTFTPDPALVYLTPYTVAIDTTAADLFGNHLDTDDGLAGAQGYEIHFTTQQIPTPPRVLSMVAASGSDSVSVARSIRVCFSRPIDPATADDGSFRIVPDGAPTLSGRFAWLTGDSVLLWKPAPPDTLLAFDTRYTVTADTLLTDIWGFRLDQDSLAAGLQAFVDSFTTRPETLAPRVDTLLVGEGVTGTGAPVDAAPVLVFSEPVDSTSLKVEGVVTLKRGALDVGFSLHIAASADSATLVPDALLGCDAEYTVEVDTLIIDVLGNRLDQDPLTAGRQPYAGLFATEADCAPPEIASTLPDSAALHVSPDVEIRIAFSEPLDESTLHTGSVILEDFTHGGDVPASVSWSASDTTVVLQPAAALIEATTFQVRLTTEVADPAGRSLASGYTFPFTTGQRPLIVWSGGQGSRCVTGRLGPHHDPDLLTVAFDAGSSYDPDSTGGTDSVAVAVWNWGDGSDADSLVLPANLLVRSHEFACSDSLLVAGCDERDNDGDGEVDETGADGCDESYPVILRLYDTHGIPSLPDTIGVSFCGAFLVHGSSPVSGATDVSPGDSLRFWFTGEIDLGAVNPATVIFQTQGGTAVDYAKAIEEAGSILRLVPDDPLTADSTYTVTLSGELTEEGTNARLDQQPCDDQGYLGYTITFTVTD